MNDNLDILEKNLFLNVNDIDNKDYTCRICNKILFWKHNKSEGEQELSRMESKHGGK